jgi:hypothetical protein
MAYLRVILLETYSAQPSLHQFYSLLDQWSIIRFIPDFRATHISSDATCWFFFFSQTTFHVLYRVLCFSKFSVTAFSAELRLV